MRIDLLMFDVVGNLSLCVLRNLLSISPIVRVNKPDSLFSFLDRIVPIVSLLTSIDCFDNFQILTWWCFDCQQLLTCKWSGSGWWGGRSCLVLVSLHSLLLRITDLTGFLKINIWNELDMFEYVCGIVQVTKTCFIILNRSLVYYLVLIEIVCWIVSPNKRDTFLPHLYSSLCCGGHYSFLAPAVLAQPGALEVVSVSQWVSQWVS